MNNAFLVRTLGSAKFNAPARNNFVEDEGVLVRATVPANQQYDDSSPLMEKAGPRRKLFFNPRRTHAAIVSCGGLCPGINDVIRGITMVLWHRYGVRQILGLRYGYEGLAPSFNHEPFELTPSCIEDIHKDGGTILGTSRGPQDVGQMVNYLEQNGINILFTIGGDGTQRGAMAITDEIEKRGLEIAVVGIPKTIDNDIMYTQRSFGFETAVAMSEVPITCAHREATGVRDGVGLVKLMGRESGFVAAHATIASGDVNLLLVPEVPFQIENVLSLLENRLPTKHHAMIVVAEGAGQDLAPGDGTDASGNKKLGDIGLFLKQAILEHFKTPNTRAQVRYIDPSYSIRSAPANASDSCFCFQLAEKAVHAAMAGRTRMVTGLWNGSFVHVPIEKAVEQRNRINPLGSLWHSVLDNTGQNF